MAGSVVLTAASVSPSAWACTLVAAQVPERRRLRAMLATLQLPELPCLPLQRSMQLARPPFDMCLLASGTFGAKCSLEPLQGLSTTMTARLGRSS